jgi:hypothetical protein
VTRDVDVFGRVEAGRIEANDAAGESFSSGAVEGDRHHRDDAVQLEESIQTSGVSDARWRTAQSRAMGFASEICSGVGDSQPE